MDIGFAVDLKGAAGLLREAREGCAFRPDPRTPLYLNLQPPPVHMAQAMEPLRGQTFITEDRVTLTLYDFGAVSMDYRIPFEGTLRELVAASSELYDTAPFAVDSRRRAGDLLDTIRPAVRRPKVREEGEDYLLFDFDDLPAGMLPDRFLEENAPLLAQVLGSNTRPLSPQQQREELSRRISYYVDDLTIITWNAALVFGPNMEDVRTVLELANVQLRELHYLDNQLDESLQESYEVSARSGSIRDRLRRIRELRLDGQAFSEAVGNAFKPFPDAFLARLYSMASESLGLSHFNQTIRDKLSLLNTLYTTLADEADHERSLRLEWIVIILIAIEIVLGLWEKGFAAVWRFLGGGP